MREVFVALAGLATAACGGDDDRGAGADGGPGDGDGGGPGGPDAAFDGRCVTQVAAGGAHASVKQADLDRRELLVRIRNAAEVRPLLARDHKLLASNAARLFGSWKKAVRAAGCADALPQPAWNKARVIEQIRADLASGLAVNTLAVIARNQPLYGAARRAFGSWVRALRAVDPKLVRVRWKRGTSIIATQ